MRGKTRFLVIFFSISLFFNGELSNFFFFSKNCHYETMILRIKKPRMFTFERFNN